MQCGGTCTCLTCTSDAEAPKLKPLQSSGTAATQADLDRVTPEESLYWRAIRIPRWMWSKVALNEPIGSKLQLSGVCISLREYIPRSDHTSATTGMPANSTEAGSQPINTKRASQAASQPQVDFKHSDSAHKGIPPIATHRASAQQPAVTHTLLRQWGAEVSVTILPVGWTKETRDSALAPNTVVAPGQPWNLQTRGTARLNSIFESHEGSGDDGTPTSSSVKSLFHSNANGHQAADHEASSPGLLFTNRQSNPLCTFDLLLLVLAVVMTSNFCF